jgi:acylphosphatase
VSEGDVRVELRIFGRVQGVGFRYATEREARALGLRGFVRNLADGSVEIVAEGDQGAVERLIAWAKHGPRHASVERVEETRSVATGDASGFTAR